MPLNERVDDRFKIILGAVRFVRRISRGGGGELYSSLRFVIIIGNSSKLLILKNFHVLPRAHSLLLTEISAFFLCKVF